MLLYDSFRGIWMKLRLVEEFNLIRLYGMNGFTLFPLKDFYKTLGIDPGTFVEELGDDQAAWLEIGMKRLDTGEECILLNHAKVSDVEFLKQLQ